MKTVSLNLLGAVLLILFVAEHACGGQTAPSAEQDGERLFALKVLPLMKAKCFACHGDDPDDIRGDLDMTSREGLLRGGESGEASLVPGNPSASPLFDAVSWGDLQMPPKENDRLTDAQVELIHQWISQGAPWPSQERQKELQQAEWQVRENEDGVIIPTSGGTSDEWTYRRYAPQELWAFRPVPGLSELVPAEAETGAEVVDYYINRGLSRAGLQAAASADARTLIRRATFDLIGLPPTPREVREFETASAADADSAWAALIDRLLASPHYGERWGQHWLDVTRYADTGGYSNDYERSNAWRYRDYVIRSFNEDKPYNEFIVEQLAGDELADESVRSRVGNDEAAVHAVRLSGDYTQREAEWLIATGFLRMGPWDNAMVMPEEARQIYLDDVVNIVGQTFLSTTMRCVKCHDHKFDPIPTRDYYRMYAAFAATQMAERPVPFLDRENREGTDEGRAHLQRMLDFAVQEKDRLIAKRESAARAWFEERGLPYRTEQERRNLPDEEKPPRHVGLDHVDEGQLKVREQDEWIWRRRLERYQPMAQSVFNTTASDRAWNAARKLRMGKKTEVSDDIETWILTGGSLQAKGDRVGPGVLSGTGFPPASAPSDDPYVIDSAVPGRRLALAEWIADARNPLTARSFVNRLWQHHFGRGLAANPNNFGTKGAPPTHPDLLNWLAADFTEHGWSVKRMHRQIMMSETYRRASRPADQETVSLKDPGNRLLSFFSPRRLTAEEIRDSLLAVTGELNRSIGGLPAMPEINMEVALQPRMIQFSLAPAYQPSRTPKQRNRRSVYAYRVRGQADPFMELFNQPNPNESCEARDSAAVTPQAFSLLNSDMTADRAIAMALRLERESDDDSERLQRAFLLLLNRTPDGTEQSRLKEYLNRMTAYHTEHKAEPITYPTAITRSLVEEFSGRPFEYEEILPVFENYVPDRKAADVSPGTRALADVCLLVMNANEFCYVE